MKKTNKTKFAILGVLNMGPGSGYDIKKFFDISVSNFWNENYAHIYPVLKELESEGLVVSTEEKSPGRPSKLIYSITEKGRGVLAEWLESPVERVPARNEMLLKLFFSVGTPKEKVIAILEDKKNQYKKELDEYSAIEEMLNSSLKEEKGLPFWLATIHYGKQTTSAAMEWCCQTIRTIQDIHE